MKNKGKNTYNSPQKNRLVCHPKVVSLEAEPTCKESKQQFPAEIKLKNLYLPDDLTKNLTFFDLDQC